MDTERPPRPMTAWLERAPPPVFVLWAVVAAFTTYFSMYAFRKPFQAVTYDGLTLAGLDLKTVLAISQLIGYTAAKYVGTKYVSEVRPGQRAKALVGLILVAQVSLVAFAVLPPAAKPLAILVNGIPLGMIWGLVVLYLEGRRSSELLLAGLATSYILASGVVKDVGRAVISVGGVDVWWMPAATGLMFLPLFVAAVWALDQLPQPSAEDRRARVERKPMDAAQRREFVHTFSAGLALHLVLYFFVTAFRDFRDIYGIEVFTTLGYAGEPAIFSATELLVAGVAIAGLAMLNFVRSDHPYALLANYGMMAVGLVLLGGGTVAFDTHLVDGLTWMILVGMGGYLVYVANGTVFWDRLIASTGFVGTAVFAVYLTDAVGYSGSVGLQLLKTFFAPEMSHLDFLRVFSYGLTVLGAAIMVFNAAYFVRIAKRRAQ